MMWAQNWPEPTSASPQLASALSLEAGWTWATWQAGRPFDCRRPWRLTLTLSRSSWGGGPPVVAGAWAGSEEAIRGGGGRPRAEGVDRVWGRVSAGPALA